MPFIAMLAAAEFGTFVAPDGWRLRRAAACTSAAPRAGIVKVWAAEDRTRREIVIVSPAHQQHLRVEVFGWPRGRNGSIVERYNGGWIANRRASSDLHEFIGGLWTQEHIRQGIRAALSAAPYSLKKNRNVRCRFAG